MARIFDSVDSFSDPIRALVEESADGWLVSWLTDFRRGSYHKRQADYLAPTEAAAKSYVEYTLAKRKELASR